MLKAALDLRGLRVSEPWASTYFTVNAMEERTLESFHQQLNFIKTMGGTDVVVAELGRAVHQQPVAVKPNKPVMTDAQWKLLTNGLNRLGRIAKDASMRLCYHHHMGTVVQTREEVDRLMAETDAELVHLLYDTGHYYWGGGDPGDPLQLATDHVARIKHVHLKDIRDNVLQAAQRKHLSFLEAMQEGVFTVPGDGVIDFKPILKVLSDNGFEGWLMVEAEQDARKAHPLTYAMKARAYLKDVIGW